jgi:hypothetical protein
MVVEAGTCIGFQVSALAPSEDTAPVDAGCGPFEAGARIQAAPYCQTGLDIELVPLGYECAER